MAAHGEALRRETQDSTLVRQIKEDHRRAPLDRKTRALLEYAERMTRDASSLTKADLHALRALGLRDEAILEAVHVTGLYNYMDRVADALGVEIDPEFQHANEDAPPE